MNTRNKFSFTYAPNHRLLAYFLLDAHIKKSNHIESHHNQSHQQTNNKRTITDTFVFSAPDERTHAHTHARTHRRTHGRGPLPVWSAFATRACVIIRYTLFLPPADTVNDSRVLCQRQQKIRYHTQHTTPTCSRKQKAAACKKQQPAATAAE